MKWKRKLLPLMLVSVFLLAGALSGCSDGVIELSPEEEAKWVKEQNELFEDVWIPAFEAWTIDGRTVTSEECFRDYQLTMINIWGTFCGPCIDEMPELAKLYDDLPAGVNLITICTDAGDSDKNLEFAQQVVKKSEGNFHTLIPDAVLKRALTDRVTSFPTTIFVDSEGKIVGERYWGSQDAEGYRAEMVNRLQSIETEAAKKGQNP